jgi:Protein of unknown function DUF115
MPDDATVKFDIRTPDETTARAQQAENERRALPEAVRARSVIIVASGPSASDSAVWERLASGVECSVALNGALSLFLERGLRPTYWCACDPQPLVADFLPDNPPPEVVYLVASKCHPSVFEKLRGRDVRIWRLDDFTPLPEGKLAVQCAVSITLVTMGLFRMKGYHRFETWGWDCCYLDDRHHASTQPLPADNDLPLELRNEAGDVLKRYRTTGTWMAEINDAAILAQNFSVMSYRIAINGGGAVGEILRGRGII